MPVPQRLKTWWMPPQCPYCAARYDTTSHKAYLQTVMAHHIAWHLADPRWMRLTLTVWGVVALCAAVGVYYWLRV